MKKIALIITAAISLAVVSSCDIARLDNPSKVSPSAADPNLLLNQVQTQLPSFFYTMSDYDMQMTRMTHFYGPNFENGFTPLSFDGIWTTAYQGILVNAKTLIPLADSKSLFMHEGMAQVIYAYTMMTLVDNFGDVPYSEALDPTNLNPKADGGASIYAACITMLDDAIANFGKTELSKPYDLFYGGNKARWITLANTLKFKAYMQTRLVDANAITKAQAITDLIDLPSENWVYQYSTNIANPDSRHPYFTGNYLTGAGTFHSNSLMWEMQYGKQTGPGGTPGVVDPRIRYYFYRQSSPISQDVNLLGCIGRPRVTHYTNPRWPFCWIKDPADNTSNVGYWGRDFGDATGVNPDTQARTNWGVYPIGGAFDNQVVIGTGTATVASGGTTVTGAGTSFTSLFTKGEQLWDATGRVLIGTIASVDSDTQLTLKAGAAAALAGEAYQRGYQRANTSSDGLSGAGILPMFMSFHTNFLRAELALITGSPATAQTQMLAGVTNSIDYVQSFGSSVASGPVPGAAEKTAYINAVTARYAAAATASAQMDVIQKEQWIASFGNGVEVYNAYRRTGAPAKGTTFAQQLTLSANPGTYYRSFTYPSVYVTRNSNATQKTSDGVKVFWDNNPDGFIN